MPTVAIETQGCRGCRMCVDVCPTDVFDMTVSQEAALVARDEDCIGCSSCEFVCPSRCIQVDIAERQRPFHRIEQNAALVARMLRRAPLTDTLQDSDLEEARKDVAVRLRALAASVTETMGRGQRVVGRSAGTLAAEHLPEAYEEATLDGILSRLSQRFKQSFEFDADVDAEAGTVGVCFRRCALASIVEEGGQTVGQSNLCTLFHEYWSGLLSAFSGQTYALDGSQQGEACTIQLHRKR